MGDTPRDGFSPHNPQQAAGTRIDPAASVACAMATIPLATAAAAPPEEPPGVRVASNGLVAGGRPFGSVDNAKPTSGTAVRPNGTKPAARNRANKALSCRGVSTRLAMAALPAHCFSPRTTEPKSLPRKGTPENGPDAAPSAKDKASSIGSMQAIAPGVSCARARLAAIASRAVIRPAAMAAARAVASVTDDQAGSFASIGTSNSPAWMAARFASIAGMASAGTMLST